jgi:hypothetical protein
MVMPHSGERSTGTAVQQWWWALAHAYGPALGLECDLPCPGCADSCSEPLSKPQVTATLPALLWKLGWLSCPLCVSVEIIKIPLQSIMVKVVKIKWNNTHPVLLPVPVSVLWWRWQWTGRGWLLSLQWLSPMSLMFHSGIINEDLWRPWDLVLDGHSKQGAHVVAGNILLMTPPLKSGRVGFCCLQLGMRIESVKKTRLCAFNRPPWRAGICLCIIYCA